MSDRGEQNRATCRDCGGACGRWTRRRDRGAVRCMDCQRAVEDVRRTLGEGMWALGWSWREVQQTLGVSYTALSVFRARGWDLPYRYKMRDGVRVA